jgi:hypothetical protein
MTDTAGIVTTATQGPTRLQRFPVKVRAFATGAVCRQVASRSLANEPGERASASRGNSSEAGAESILFAEA